MRRTSEIICIASLLPLLFLQSCVKTPPPVKNFPEANEKFLSICKKEYQLNVITKKNNRTLWIYLPIEKSIIDYKGTQEGPKKSNHKTTAASLQYVDAHFKDGNFYVEYAADQVTNYSIDYGYQSIYGEEYQQIQNHILTAIFRAYGDLEDTKTESTPEFFMVVIADIKKGIEVTSLFTLEDFKQAQLGFLSPEEFVKRNITEIRGQESIVGDTVGNHLDYHDITWNEFITNQMLNRIRFKYQHSDFKPGNNAEEEIISQIAQTFLAYHFTDYVSVELTDLNNQKTISLERSKVGTFAK